MDLLGSAATRRSTPPRASRTCRTKRDRRAPRRREPPRSPAAPDPARSAREAHRSALRQARRAHRGRARVQRRGLPAPGARCRRRTASDLRRALLASYQGDYLQVLRHVRIERFEISHRYRTGWVTVEPQLSVDATERQITADRTPRQAAAALAAIRVAARVRRRRWSSARTAGDDRVRRSAQAAARALQVPAHERRARRAVDDERDPVPRSDLHGQLQRHPPLRVPRDPGLPELQGALRARARAVHPRHPPRGSAVRGAPARGRRREAHRAAHPASRRGAVGGAPRACASRRSSAFRRRSPR